jgi:two-component system, NtrC family, sensor histidine kinase PilS
MTSDSRRRLVWLISTRVVVSTLLLGSAVVFQVNAPGTLAVDPFFFLIGLTYGLSVIYAIMLRYVDRLPWLVSMQFAGDILTVTAFIHFTGGMTSYFQLLYVLPIVGAAAVQMRRGARRLALLSALLYSTLVLHQYTGGAGYIGGAWVPDVRPFLPPIRVASYTVAANAIAFVAVALLSGSLAERLQRADDRLAVASTALADLQAFNQHVIESLTSGLITTDRAGRVVSLNRAAEQIMSLPAHQAIGQRAADLLQVPPAFAELLDAELGAQSQRADYAYRTADGARREIGLSAAHLVTPDGWAGHLLTFQDVTETRRLERDARRRQRLAAVGEMAAGIAHEIRNPLASMRGSIQVLRSELSLNDEQASLMDIVLRESDRLNDTIRSFLAYARPQATVPAPVDLVRVLTDAATLLRNSPELKRGHRVIVDGPSQGGLVVDADDHQIRQVVWNLATNGLRAMPSGGTLRLVARPVSQTDGHVELAVVDEGVGIPPEQLDMLFQPFHGSFGQGSGLGLAIVHRIVQDHRGEVVVESAVGRGTQVTVRLPSCRAVQAELVRAD